MSLVGTSMSLHGRRPSPVTGRGHGWLIWVFDQASNLLLRALRIEPVHDVEHSATARDLAHILQESRESGDLRSSCRFCWTASSTSPTRTSSTR